MATNGIVLIKPTSVAKTGASSTATINAGGSVTFSLCESLSLNGVFSSTYDNYIIDIRGTGSVGAGVRFRLRASGTDATGGNYTVQQLLASSTTVSGQRFTSQTRALVGFIGNTQRAGTEIFIYGPNLAQPTAIRNISASDFSSAYIEDYASTHSLSTAYDGFTIYADTGNGTFSGLVKVYGLVK